MAKKTAGNRKGQDKTYTVTLPQTGETREVTQAQWRGEQLAKLGWMKPEEMPDEEETDESAE